MKTCLHLNKVIAYSNDLIWISVNYHTHATVRGRDTGWKTFAVWQLKKKELPIWPVIACRRPIYKCRLSSNLQYWNNNQLGKLHHIIYSGGKSISRLITFYSFRSQSW